MSEAGVTFAVRRNSDNGYDVVFDSLRGVMEIPTILIDDAKTPLLANLIAFEQSLGNDEAILLSSYVALMGQLIVTARDVALLRRRGVLENMLANDDDAARFFNHLGDCGAVNHDSHRRALQGRGPLLRDMVAEEDGGAPARLLRQPVVGHLLRRRRSRRRARSYADLLHHVSIEKRVNLVIKHNHTVESCKISTPIVSGYKTF
jgi:hypothetical protein